MQRTFSMHGTVVIFSKCMGKTGHRRKTTSIGKSITEDSGNYYHFTMRALYHVCE